MGDLAIGLVLGMCLGTVLGMWLMIGLDEWLDRRDKRDPGATS